VVVACGVAVAIGVGEIVGLGEGEGVSIGGALADGDGAADALGEGVGVGFAFFFAVDFFRCGRGVGDGPVNSLLIFAPSESWSSWAVRAWVATAIARVIAITSKERSFVFTEIFCSVSGGQFLQHSLIHSDAGVEILQREILVGRMGTAIGQGQPQQ
jgi:hypothetical protein